ncbi:hypothetical protein BY996DRAFT_6469477 [Phakopsora pachyrhizi]|nr:hypothetical protein BY996DRAFT_6469477 [Phakopsora pachyrhizi]
MAALPIGHVEQFVVGSFLNCSTNGLDLESGAIMILINRLRDLLELIRDKEVENGNLKPNKLNHNHQSALSSLDSLQIQYADLQRDHPEALEKIKSLTEQSIEAEDSFQKEIEAQKRVTELMEKQDKQWAKRMEQYEQEWNVRREELDQREKEMNKILDNERRRISELEQKLDDRTPTLS